ncbi:MAG: glycosyl transferase [Nitrospinaceae bacterium]|nr:MAG: glycosyl transferase [Nitrospinaceae bacterium]
MELIRPKSSAQEVEPFDERKKIALVVPAFNESRNLQQFFKEVQEAIRELGSYSWEFIFVNDGSSDNTWELTQYLADADPRVKGVSLSRNFGKEIALTAGVEAVSDADAVIFIDADLQHPPSIIAELIAEWENGYQIVATRREAIQYSLMRKAGSRIFYYMLKHFSDLEIHPKATDFRLLDRDVLKVLKTFEERTRFFRGLIDWMGFRKTFVTFSAPDRFSGVSTFNLRHLTNLAVNSFTSFSLLPLRVTGWLGLSVVTLTLMVLFYMMVTQFAFGEIYTPLAYFVVFNTLLFGVVLAALGLIALYIGHIHIEVIRRPLYIVQDRIGFEDE